MPINRFYNPQLPEYTSQFVEDKTPWAEMMAWDQEKIEQTGKATEAAANFESAVGSLPITGRTKEFILPKIEEDYKKEIAKWSEKYGENPASLPAMRELTRLNSRFRSDPNVKTVLKDYEEEQEQYNKWKNDPMYPLSIDPNIDKATGGLKQFKPGDAYTSYARPFDINTYLDTQFSAVEGRIVPYKNMSTVKDPKTGFEIPVLEQGERKIIDQSDFAGVMPDIFQSVRAVVPETSMSNEELMSAINRRQSKFFKDQRVSQVSQISGYGSSDSDKNPYDEGGLKAQGPLEPQIERTGRGPDEGRMPLSKSIPQFIESKETKNLYKMTSGANEETYQNVKNNIASLIEGNFEFKEQGFPKLITPGSPKDMFVKRAIKEDPAGFMERFNAFKKSNANPDNKTKRNMEHIQKLMDAEYADMNIQSKPFSTDLQFDDMKYSAIQSGKIGMQGVPFKSETELKNLTKENATPEQNFWLNANSISQTKDMSKAYGRSTIETLPDEMIKALERLYGGKAVDNQGQIQVSGSSWTLKGARVINPGNPDDEMTSKEKDKEFTKDKAFFIEGMLTPESSQYSPGTLVAKIGEKSYYIQAPDNITEPLRFSYAANSYKQANANGRSDLFVVRNGLSQYIDITDRWTKGKKQPTLYDIPMQVRLNPKNGQVEILAYKEDPDTIKEKALWEPFSDKNKKGYSIYKIPMDEQPTDDVLEYGTRSVWVNENLKKAMQGLSESKANDKREWQDQVDYWKDILGQLNTE